MSDTYKSYGVAKCPVAGVCSRLKYFTTVIGKTWQPNYSANIRARIKILLNFARGVDSLKMQSSHSNWNIIYFCFSCASKKLKNLKMKKGFYHVVTLYWAAISLSFRRISIHCVNEQNSLESPGNVTPTVVSLITNRSGKNHDQRYSCACSTLVQVCNV